MSDTRLHYLDNAATTPVDPEVAESMARHLREEYGNPSSLYPLGARAARLLDESREILTGMVGATRVVFTGGGTEATNLAMRGTFLGKEPGRILIGAADHPATRETARALSEEMGCELSIYEVDERCQPVMEDFEAKLGEDLRLVSILYGNNEVGSLPPIERMSALVRQKAPRAHLHGDVVQAFAKVPVDLEHMDLDSISLAAHKIHGPKGVGALALGPKRNPRPLMTGGGQEMGQRSGTENVCGIRAFVDAAERWASDMANIEHRLRGYGQRLLATLDEQGIAHRRLGDRERCLPHILSLSFEGIHGEVAMNHLAERGLYVSTGSACSQKGEQKKSTGSSVLRAMDLPTEVVQGTLRISFGRFTDAEDLETLERELPAVVQHLQALGL